MAETVAVFHKSGICPVSRHFWQILQRKGAITSDSFLRIFVDIISSGCLVWVQFQDSLDTDLDVWHGRWWISLRAKQGFLVFIRELWLVLPVQDVSLVKRIIMESTLVPKRSNAWAVLLQIFGKALLFICRLVLISISQIYEALRGL